MTPAKRRIPLAVVIGGFGVGVAILLWGGMIALLKALPADGMAPVMTGADMLLGAVVAAALLGGIGAVFGALGDR
ncbi:hypothetical protein [Novispirillum itersonii]|uniref:hypothetical protein n=1 Tax=Novispirillum itersonii TaxID=189 RepID=UPI00037F1FF9|nr:hypothetical protein [Novispirillum itersonii]